VAVVAASAAPPARRKRGILRRSLRPLAYLWCPTGLLILFFLVPMVIMLKISFHHDSLYDFRTGWTLDNYREIITDPIYRQVALDTFWISTAAMAIQLAIGLPLAYVMAFKAGRFELPLLLALVLADELNPIVRIYAWRQLLGREGLINDALQWLHITSAPVDWLLFSKFAVILVLSTSWLRTPVAESSRGRSAITSISSTTPPGLSLTSRLTLSPTRTTTFSLTIFLNPASSTVTV